MADMEEDEEMYLEADIEEDHVLADMEDDEKMHLLEGRYGGGREDVPVQRQIWRRTSRCTWRQILRRAMSWQI